jgi:hypothetical protein
MGYVAAEYFAYVIIVLVLGGLLFGATATVLLVKEGVPVASNAVHRLAVRARGTLSKEFGLLMSHLLRPTQHIH